MIDIKLIPTVTLLRLQDDDDYGTLGVFLINGQVFCSTIEPPDRLNAVGKSSVPAGQYICVRYQSARFMRELFKLINVPGRTAIAIHSGKQVDHTQGCILLGQYWDKLKYERQLMNTGQTLEKFMQIMAGTDRFLLTIKNVF
jgi:hypothetical protein